MAGSSAPDWRSMHQSYEYIGSREVKIEKARQLFHAGSVVRAGRRGEQDVIARQVAMYRASGQCPVQATTGECLLEPEFVKKDIPSIEFGANPSITIVAKNVKDYAPTGEGIRGSFADLYIQP
ncbi:hypothetical protein QFZ91_001326 [Paraburkholderia sp. JPY419]